MTVGALGLGRGPDPAAVALDDAPGDGQAAGPALPAGHRTQRHGVVCPTSGSRAMTIQPWRQAVGDAADRRRCAGRSLFAQNRPKKCRKA